MRELRSLGIGLVLGVCLVLTAGQAAAPREAGGPRYSVTASHPQPGSYEFFIVDHTTNKIYHRTDSDLRPSGTPIEELIAR